MRTRTVGLWCVVVVATVLVQSGYAQQRPISKLDDLIKAAQNEGELTLMGGGATWGESEGIKAIQDAVNKKYGLNIRIRYAAGPAMGVMATRVIEQHKAGVKADTDLLVLGAPFVPDALDAGVLSSFNWREVFSYIPEDVVEFQGQLIRHADALMGITYNTREIPEKDVPQSLADVLLPKWKGKIASTPYAAPLNLLAPDRLWGYEKATTFVRALSKQIGGLIRCGEEPRIASGEFLMLVMNCGSYASENYARKTGAPVSAAVMKDAPLSDSFYLTIPKNSAHPNLAALVIGFLMSKEGQDILYRMVGWSSASVEGTNEYTRFKDLKARGIELKRFTATTYMKEGELLRRTMSEYMKILAGR